MKNFKINGCFVSNKEPPVHAGLCGGGEGEDGWDGEERVQ